MRIVQGVCLAFMVGISACAQKEGTHSGISEEARADLQRLANAVQSMKLPDTNSGQHDQGTGTPAKPGLSARAVDSSVDPTLSQHVEEWTFTDPDMGYTVSGRTEYFDVDMNEITKGEAQASGDYRTKEHQTYRDGMYESTFDLQTHLKFTIPSGEITTFDFSVELTGSGQVNYYNDGLVLSIDTVNASVSQANGLHLDYGISMMDGKYHFTLKQDVASQDLGTANEPSVIAGDIFDKSEIKVGVFELHQDGSVTIRDVDGNIIQSAGQGGR